MTRHRSASLADPGHAGARPTALVLVVALLLTLVQVGRAEAASLSASTVTSSITATNVTPMWGPQLPRIIHDGPSGWYYTVNLDGNGTQYPWNAEIWKSSDGVNWTLAQSLGPWVYQPPSLVMDSGNRLWLVAPCYTGGQCYPGLSPASGGSLADVYLARLQFDTRNGDGSFDFSSWNDHSVRTSTSERYYAGTAIDPTRRYILQAYAVDGWTMHFSRFDTWTGTDTTTAIATPGTDEAYLYPRVRPGTSTGEVWMSFMQYDRTGANSATIFGVQLWRSTDWGQTWQAFMVASCPNPDGIDDWCDAADLVIDSADRPHVLFYKEVSGVQHLYYWRGNAGSVSLPGSPVDLGAYDNHSQLGLISSQYPIVFTHNGPGTTSTDLRVLRSTDYVNFSSSTYAISGAADVYSPNLHRPETGSWTGSSFQMLVSVRPTGGSSFSRMDFLEYVP